jgi:hypothetical protein
MKYLSAAVEQGHVEARWRLGKILTSRTVDHRGIRFKV